MLSGSNLIAHDMEATLAFYRRLGAEIPESAIWRTAPGAHHVTVEMPGGFSLHPTGRQSRRMMNRLAVVLVPLLALAVALACGPPPFVVHVTWAGEITLEEGAPVLYEGVKVGEVLDVSLRQERPERAAMVAVSLAIADESVQLRTGDRFHIASHRGVAVVEVEPNVQPSPPLEAGATVPGVPPLITRIEDEINEAIEGIGKAALEAVDEAIAEFQRSEGSPPYSRPLDDAPLADSTPAR